MFRKIQNYSKNDVIRAKRAGLDTNGAKCVRGVSGACRGRVGACRGRVGGVSGACRGRVGGVSGACRARVGTKFSNFKLFSNKKRQFCNYLPENASIFNISAPKQSKTQKKRPKLTERH